MFRHCAYYLLFCSLSFFSSFSYPNLTIVFFYFLYFSSIALGLVWWFYPGISCHFSLTTLTIWLKVLWGKFHGTVFDSAEKVGNIISWRYAWTSLAICVKALTPWNVLENWSYTWEYKCKALPTHFFQGFLIWFFFHPEYLLRKLFIEEISITKI